MTTDLEARLSADMERFTREVRVPPGLALRAYRRGRQRRARLRAVVAAGTAAAAVAIAGVTGAFGSPAAPPIQTTAYVLKQVDSALAPANIGNLIGFTRIVYTSHGSLGPLVHASPSSSLARTCRGATLLRWEYGGTEKLSVYGPRDRHIFDARASLAERSRTDTEVIYCNRTWWTSTRPSASSVVSPTAGFSARIRSWIASGWYTVAGHQVVDGIDAIKLTATKTQATLWVNPVTYRPVRLDSPQLQIDYQWLRPTAANLALLTEPVPAGFQQVPPPAQP